MKTIFTYILLILATVSVKAQCSTTYGPANNCASYGDQIDAFTLNSIASGNSAGCSSNGYGLYSTPVWNLQIGNTYAWSMSVGSGIYSQGVAIWIDLNNNGIYAANEMLYASSTANTSHSGNITIPFTSSIGTNFSMRIRCGYNYSFSGSDACTDNVGTWGETEDYKVNITCPSGAPTVTVAATNTHICIGQTVTITATGASNYSWTGGITNGVGFSPSSTTSYTLVAGVSGCSSATTTAVRTISVSTTPIVIAAATSTNTLCAGSPALLTGAGALNYTWMPVNLNGSTINVAPTANTTYTLIGYNGTGCPGTASVSITVNPIPTITAISTPSNLCAGHIATLSVSGALTYSWQSLNSSQTTVTVSPQNPTSYAVTGYNSFGCSNMASAVVVTQASPPTTASSSKTLTCIGSTVNLTAAGASSYQWSNGPATAAYQVGPTASTVYTVTGTGSNGCTKEATVAVNVFQATISVSQNTSVCQGGAVAINAGSAQSYSWNVTPGNMQQIFITPSVTTVYMLDATVNVNSQSCKASNAVTVTVNLKPVVTASGLRSTICRGESTTITATGANSYLWNTNAATPSFTVKGNVAQTLNYSVTGTDANGCKGTGTVSLKIDLCQSLSEQAASDLFNAFPNPNAGSFNIKANRAMTLVITNELGQLIKTISVNDENLFSAEVSGLSTGVYFISEQGSHTAVRNKVVVLK